MTIQFFAYLRDPEFAGCREIPWPHAPTLRALGEQLCEAFGAKFREEFFAPGSEALGERVIVMVNGRRAEFLEQLGETMQDCSLCTLGKSAPNPVLTTLQYFREKYEAHIRELCRQAVRPGTGRSLPELPAGADGGGLLPHLRRVKASFPAAMDRTMTAGSGKSGGTFAKRPPLCYHSLSPPETNPYGFGSLSGPAEDGVVIRKAEQSRVFA